MARLPISPRRTAMTALIRSRFVRVCVTTTVVLLHVVFASAEQRPAKLDTALANGINGPVRVIVRTNAGQTSDLSERLRQRGKSVLKQHTLINGVTVVVNGDELADLVADPSVVDVSLDAL